jgi:hypothetical protein
MVAFGRSLFCTDAEPYYYDYLRGLDADIPHAVADHILHCAHCRAQIRQLEAAIADSEAQDGTPKRDADVIGTLSLHFAHLGEDITCDKAKAFLPVLLVPSLEIRIPTPITVHVDHCQQCAEDLEAIRGLALRPEQLARLSRLYAAISDSDPLMCRRARAKTWAFACASFDGIDARTLDHMCVCPRCRRRVHRCRERILAGRELGDTIPGAGLCSGVSMADLFEWVVPYGRREGNHEHARDGDGAMPAHLQACPECIERMQALHCTIYGVAERVDSGVSTVYTTDSRAKPSGGAADSFYCGYPVRVGVAYRDPEPAATRLGPISGIRRALGQRLAGPRLGPVLRTTLLAAAVIPLVLALFVNIRPASAIRVPQLSDAINTIENLHLTRYGRDGTRVVEELWVARARLVARRSAREETLYDLTAREKVVRDREQGTLVRKGLTQDDYMNATNAIRDALEPALANAPKDRMLEPLAPDAVEGIEPGEVAYRCTWDSEGSNGLVMHRRLTVFLDPGSGLPRKMEWFRLMPDADDEQWQRMDTYEFEIRQNVEIDIRRLFPEWQNHSGDHRGL